LVDASQIAFSDCAAVDILLLSEKLFSALRACDSIFLV
jgi:hypothetical protein